MNNIFHAQPGALLMLAGLAFITIGIVGSIKTYFDPGNAGRVAAGAIGGVLLIAGLFMYKPAAAAPTASSPPSSPPLNAPPPVSPSKRPHHSPPVAAAGQVVARSSGTAGQTTTFCYIPGKWPLEVGKTMVPGDICSDAKGDLGRAVVTSRVCNYTSGPLNGSSAQFNHEMYVGYSCVSHDKLSHGTVLVPWKN